MLRPVPGGVRKPRLDLPGHWTRAADAAKTLVGVGMADYRAELEAFLKTVLLRPVLVGHSMGGVASGLKLFVGNRQLFTVLQ